MKLTNKHLSCLNYSWKVCLKRKLQSKFSQRHWFSTIECSFEVWGRYNSKFFSVQIFQLENKTISLPLVTHLVAKLLNWVLKRLCSSCFRKQTNNSKVSWIPLYFKKKGSQEELKRKTTVRETGSYQESCFSASFVIYWLCNFKPLSCSAVTEGGWD